MKSHDPIAAIDGCRLVPSPWCGRAVRCVYLLAILLINTPVHAQLDFNSNGMSDVWERFYNRANPGALFDPANPDHAPGADPDGDGWTNLQESVAGTDPFAGIPP